MKRYTGENVLEAARRRVSILFDLYENVSVSVSGGKDSTVVHHLVSEEAKRRNREFWVFFLDMEAILRSSRDLIHRKMTAPNAKPFWVQEHFLTTNNSSYGSPLFDIWNPEKERFWVHPQTELRHKNRFGFMERFAGSNECMFFKCLNAVERWRYEREGPTCHVLGVRADESFDRFKATTRNPGIAGLKWTTKSYRENVKAYPIYDWSWDDVWTYIGKHGVEYNKAYDWMWAYGVPKRKMRIDCFLHEKSFRSLAYLQAFEPDTYAKVLRRVGGAATGARYAQDDMVYRATRLPAGFPSWREYMYYLLGTVPESSAEALRRRVKPDFSESECKAFCTTILSNDTGISLFRRKKRSESTVFDEL